MSYRKGDPVLLVSFDDEVRARRVRIEDVESLDAGQRITVEGRQLDVNPDGELDTDGLTVLPLDAESARGLQLSPDGRSMTIEPTIKDPDDFQIDYKIDRRR